MDAISGWSHEGSEFIYVTGKEWTFEVARVARTVGYILATDYRDRGESGRFYACHVEKQLIAYFISNHLFLEVETGILDQKARKIHTLIRWSQYDNDDQVDVSAISVEIIIREEWPLRELALDMPLILLTRAKILVSSRPCDDCETFKNLVNHILGLDITLLDRSQKRRGNRQDGT